MTHRKISIDLNAAAKQETLDTSTALTAEQQNRLERMQALAMAIFHAFGEIFHLYTRGVYQDTTFATSCRYNYNGSIIIALTACPYDAAGNVDENGILLDLDRDIESFFKFVTTHCGFQDDLTVDMNSELPERRIIASNPHALIDLIGRMIEPFHRESLEKVGLRQTQKPNLGENYFTAFATRCLHQSLGQGNTEDATLQHFINYMPARAYSSVYAACAHGAWASYDKKLFAVSLEKLRVWADSILSPMQETAPDMTCFRIH